MSPPASSTAYEHANKLLTDGNYSFALPQPYAVLFRYPEYRLYGPAHSDTLAVIDSLVLCLHSLVRSVEAMKAVEAMEAMEEILGLDNQPRVGERRN